MIMRFLLVFCLGFWADAHADQYLCRVEMSGELDASSEAEGHDEWTVTVDLTRRVAYLHSFNEIFGENPFATLKLERKEGRGALAVFYFVGTNSYIKGHRYALEFSLSGESMLISQEGQRAVKRYDAVICRKLLR